MQLQLWMVIGQKDALYQVKLKTKEAILKRNLDTTLRKFENEE